MCVSTASLRRFESLTPEVSTLLAYAMYPDPTRIKQTLEQYLVSPQRLIFGWLSSGQLVSAAGLEMTGQQGKLLHLGTRPEQRGQGHAKQLLYAVMQQLTLRQLAAETDHHAVNFYRKAGFSVEATRTKWGQRYFCLLSQSTIHRAT